MNFFQSLRKAREERLSVEKGADYGNPALIDIEFTTMCVDCETNRVMRRKDIFAADLSTGWEETNLEVILGYTETTSRIDHEGAFFILPGECYTNGWKIDRIRSTVEYKGKAQKIESISIADFITGMTRIQMGENISTEKESIEYYKKLNDIVENTYSTKYIESFQKGIIPDEIKEENHILFTDMNVAMVIRKKKDKKFYDFLISEKSPDRSKEEAMKAFALNSKGVLDSSSFKDKTEIEWEFIGSMLEDLMDLDEQSLNLAAVSEEINVDKNTLYRVKKRDPERFNQYLDIYKMSILKDMQKAQLAF